MHREQLACRQLALEIARKNPDRPPVSALRLAEVGLRGCAALNAVVKARFAELRTMGLRTVMITGDNPLTAQAIATEAGLDDFLAEATPEDKMALIRKEQAAHRRAARCCLIRATRLAAARSRSRR